MGIEDDLFNALKYADIGGGAKLDDVLKTLATTIEINALKQLRGVLDSRIKELTSTVTGPSQGLNPFDILGVSMTATQGEVKEAYRKKAWKAHPDHGGSGDEMVRVNAAYEAIRRLRGWR